MDTGQVVTDIDPISMRDVASLPSVSTSGESARTLKL